uniref:Uncharacterized protein n=1 Tax=Timema genevievae TaxID=629358 RepID=A0A7R9K8V2_TIMGE|nr:unnamed protein product [Timema genevievae]
MNKKIAPNSWYNLHPTRLRNTSLIPHPQECVPLLHPSCHSDMLSIDMRGRP